MLDSTDVALLRLLHADARTALATLARRLSMSASATRERVRRLEDSGVITGYHAAVSAEQVGFPLLAFIRLRYPTSNYKPLHDLLGGTPEVLEAHHVTGEDCFVLKVAARDMRDLERLAGRIAALGSVTTSLVYSTLIASRPPPTATIRAGSQP
ncbi:MAG: Lrp/AsnC family transcriptional regulator [Frankia sp.]